FLLKTFVKSSVNGYIESSFVQPGQYVHRGAKLFILKTKEAHNLGNTISRMDSTFHFSGRILIRASDSGYITTLNYHSGDYVADGEQLAVISNLKSFAFLLELPYDLKSCLASNKQILLKLSDGTTLNGRATSTMPSVDPVSQTLSVVIKVNTNKQIPENLIARVILVKKMKKNAVSLSKEAILTNETQSQFWIMKMINNTTAVKVPVKIGMQTNDRVEILSPALSPNDRIILTGNYGLPDTAKVIVSHGAI
ncbi:MAG: efflux RND transporter periplasmic adaptor subunit, partial [Bacteroidota bacterium]|nr:efflux RND transporter periplasmic adaptor subunit [Bacteroidota bacterium]